MTRFLTPHSHICDFELSAWNDDLQQKIMSVKIVSKSNPLHRVEIGRIYGASISKNHFHLTSIGGKNLFCYRENKNGKRAFLREGIDIGQNGAFRDLLKIESVACLVTRHDEILETIKTWPDSNENHGSLNVHDGVLRFYVLSLIHI